MTCNRCQPNRLCLNHEAEANPMTPQEIIARLERIKPGLENSSSAAEVAMVELLPAVIAALKASLKEPADRSGTT